VQHTEQPNKEDRQVKTYNQVHQLNKELLDMEVQAIAHIEELVTIDI
jgi:hypothetical protein